MPCGVSIENSDNGWTNNQTNIKSSLDKFRTKNTRQRLCPKDYNSIIETRRQWIAQVKKIPMHPTSVEYFDSPSDGTEPEHRSNGFSNAIHSDKCRWNCMQALLSDWVGKGRKWSWVVHWGARAKSTLLMHFILGQSFTSRVWAKRRLVLSFGGMRIHWIYQDELCSVYNVPSKRLD